MMIPNEKFEIYYPDLIPKEIEPPKFSDTLTIGSYLLIQNIIESLHISELCDSIFEDDGFISDLVSYMITDETSMFQYYSQFVRNHPILSDIRSDSYISKYFITMDNESVKAFIKAWNLYANKRCVYIGYYSTNMNTSAKGIELVEYRHPKLDEELPQVNLSYALSRDDSTPLFYELYEGSIIENSQCFHIATSAKE